MDLQRFIAATVKAVKEGALSPGVVQAVTVTFDLAVRQDEQNPTQVEVDARAAGTASTLKVQFEVKVAVP